MLSLNVVAEEPRDFERRTGEARNDSRLYNFKLEFCGISQGVVIQRCLVLNPTAPDLPSTPGLHPEPTATCAAPHKGWNEAGIPRPCARTHIAALPSPTLTYQNPYREHSLLLLLLLQLYCLCKVAITTTTFDLRHRNFYRLSASNLLLSQNTRTPNLSLSLLFFSLPLWLYLFIFWKHTLRVCLISVFLCRVPVLYRSLLTFHTFSCAILFNLEIAKQTLRNSELIESILCKAFGQCSGHYIRDNNWTVGNEGKEKWCREWWKQWDGEANLYCTLSGFDNRGGDKEFNTSTVKTRDQ